jgi:hypothetical protein
MITNDATRAIQAVLEQEGFGPVEVFTISVPNLPDATCARLAPSSTTGQRLRRSPEVMSVFDVRAAEHPTSDTVVQVSVRGIGHDGKPMFVVGSYDEHEQPEAFALAREQIGQRCGSDLLSRLAALEPATAG